MTASKDTAGGYSTAPPAPKSTKGNGRKVTGKATGLCSVPTASLTAQERDWRKGDSNLDEDGSRYEGEWHDDGEQRHGWGYYTIPNLKIVHEGRWQNDKPIKEPPPDGQDDS